MKYVAKLGHYFDKRYEISFWVNLLMCAAFVVSKQYVFAGMTLTLSVIQFQPRIVIDKIPAAWLEWTRKRALQATYWLGPKSYLVSTSGVMKVVRYKRRGDSSLFVCKCSEGYTPAIAESSRFCRSTDEAVHLLASMYHQEMKDMREKLVQQPTVE